GSGQDAFGVVARRVRVVHRDTRLGQAGAVERLRVLRGHVPAVREERGEVVARKRADDVDEIGPHKGLAPLDRDEEPAHLRELGGERADLVERELLLRRDAVGPEVAEAALHVAAVGDLQETVVRPSREDPPGESELALRLLPAHGNSHPRANWRPSRAATSFRSGATPWYSESVS